MTDALEEHLATARIAARTITLVTIGPEPFDPVYPYHGAIRRCPFCEELYRRHGGFADHHDRCEEGPNPGANPIKEADS